MDTHYAKARKQPGSQMKGAMHSLLYNLMPEESLISRRSIIISYRDAIRRSEYRGLPYQEADIVGALNVLVGDGFVRELNGIKLEKIVEGRL